jgi:hypothetical protein
MHLPYLRSRKQKTEKQIVAFRGVNYGEAVRDGDLSESQNLTAERFPCMSPRGGRTAEGDYDSATAVYYFRGMRFVVDGNKLTADGTEISTVSPGKKQFAAVNNKLVVFPDKIQYDTETAEVRSLTAEYTSDAGMLEFVNNKEVAVHLGAYNVEVVRSANIGGSGLRPFLSSVERPFANKLTSVSVNKDTGQIVFGAITTGETCSGIEEGDLFVDAEKGADGVTTWGRVSKVYSMRYSSTGSDGKKDYWWQYGFDYEICKAAGTSFEQFDGFEALNFRKGDTVEISGATTFPDYNRSYTIRDFGTYATGDGETLPTMIFDADVFPTNGVEAGAVTIKRNVPNLTVVTESNNRLWGAEGNTIFASALGDPTNFYTYDGLDTDSYAVAVASEGAFTGCCGFGNSVLFWKEDKLHKILGAYPSQYTMYEYNVPGVKLGSEQSLCNINEVVYYHGREGVYRYNGGSPELISENFGLRRYEEAAAGAIEGRYYLSMKDRQKGEWGLWVYDTLKNIWLREDDTHAMGFSANEGKLYCIGGSKLMCLNPDDSGEVFEWSATTARMDEMFHNRKCYSKLLLRAELLEDSAWLQVDISCDGEPFKRVYTSRDKAAKTLAIPIMPKRCDSFRIRLSGEGKFIIRSLVREFDIGSEY